MTELAIAVDADDEMWTLDNLPTPEAPYVEVESELIEVRSRFPSSYYTLTGETLPPRIRVRRGIAGTTAASHIQGSTLTPNYGLGGGAGAGGVTISDSDPGAIGAGAQWLQTDALGAGSNYVALWTRNATNDGWWLIAYPMNWLGALGTGVEADPGLMILHAGSDIFDGLESFISIDHPDLVRLKLNDVTGSQLAVFQLVSDGGGGIYGYAVGNVSLESDAGTAALRTDPFGSDTGPHTLLLALNGDLSLDGQPIGTQAAFVANGSTVDQLRDALIASGLMAAS